MQIQKISYLSAEMQLSIAESALVWTNLKLGCIIKIFFNWDVFISGKVDRLSGEVSGIGIREDEPANVLPPVPVANLFVKDLPVEAFQSFVCTFARALFVTGIVKIGSHWDLNTAPVGYETSTYPNR